MEAKRRGEKKCAAAVEAVEKCAVPSQAKNEEKELLFNGAAAESVCVGVCRSGTFWDLVPDGFDPIGTQVTAAAAMMVVVVDSRCAIVSSAHPFFLLPTSCHIFFFDRRQDVVKCLLVCAVGIVGGSRVLYREGRTGTVGISDLEHPGRGAAEEWKS